VAAIRMPIAHDPHKNETAARQVGENASELTEVCFYETPVAGDQMLG
jgi:hypothetical protein